MVHAATKVSPRWFKAVCYKCSFEGQVEGSCCPECSFPLIFESEATPAGGTRVEDIFDRTSVRIGAPPLPGVDVGPRKAQLLAEARKRRLTARRETTAAPVAPGSRRQAFKLALVCFSAVAAGVAAAVMHHGF